LNSSKIGVDYAVARAIERSRARFEGVRSAFERSVAVRVDGRRTVGRCVGETIYPLRAGFAPTAGTARNRITHRGVHVARLGLASNIAA
jgi:hypothetical protein